MSGLGIGSASVLAICGYLTSVGSSSQLCSAILGKPSSDTHYTEALSFWHQLSSLDSPPPNHFQKSWSDPVYRMLFHDLLTEATDDKTRKRLKSFEGKIQSAWLTALPSSSLGLKLSNVQLRISVALRLGVNLCQPHVCRCGEPVETTLLSEPWYLVIFRQFWSLLASVLPIRNVKMTLPWCLGREGSPSSGMRPLLTPWHLVVCRLVRHLLARLPLKPKLVRPPNTMN